MQVGFYLVFLTKQLGAEIPADPQETEKDNTKKGKTAGPFNDRQTDRPRLPVSF